MGSVLAFKQVRALAALPVEAPTMRKIALTLSEATEVSGIGRSSLYKLFNDGKLTPRKAGKKTLILVDELETYLRNLPKGGNSHE